MKNKNIKSATSKVGIVTDKRAIKINLEKNVERGGRVDKENTITVNMSLNVG